MVHRALHLLSLFCCLTVAASFVLFAHDQVAGASQHQTAEIVGPTASGTTISGDRSVVRRRGQPRAFIDGVTKTLTAPFTSVVSSSNPWVTRGVPAALALVIYGLGLGSIARYAREQTYEPK